MDILLNSIKWKDHNAVGFQIRIAKIRRNKERDKEEQRKLAEMGWHCITVWECELTPKRCEETLESIVFTLNHIWLQDHSVKGDFYPKEEESNPISIAAEE